MMTYPCLTKHHAMTYYGSGGIAPHTLSLALGDMSNQLHTPSTLPPGKEPSDYTGKEATWAPEPV